MIKNLIKKDLKKMFKLSVVLYAVSIILALIIMIIYKNTPDAEKFDLSKKVFYMLLMYIELGTLMAIIVNTLVQICKSFKNSFYKEESYLTHTLPITRGQLLFSKYCSFAILSSVSLIVVIVSLLMIMPSLVGNVNHVMFIISKPNIYKEVMMPLWLYFICFFVVSLTDMVALASILFNSTIEGNAVNHHHTRRGILCFILYYVCYKFLKTAIVTFCTLLFSTEIDISNFHEIFSRINYWYLSGFITVMISVIVSNIIFVTYNYIVHKRKFDKFVNIE